MSEAALIVTLVIGSFTVAQDAVITVKALRAVHHHTTRVVYRHVLKPIVKKVTQ